MKKHILLKRIDDGKIIEGSSIAFIQWENTKMYQRSIAHHKYPPHEGIFSVCINPRMNGCTWLTTNVKEYTIVFNDNGGFKMKFTTRNSSYELEQTIIK